jgi:epoxyqueuosine reductase
MTPAEGTQWVCQRARAIGFDLCGVAQPDALAEDLRHFPEWLARGYAGEMKYMHDPRRADPNRVLQGARSLVVVALNYNSAQPHSSERGAGSEQDLPRGWISRYAWGEDYHQVIGEKLEALLAAMREKFEPPCRAKAYVDTGPIVERVAAKHAGLGWLGKNTCLLSAELGSWLFLGVIVTTLELAPTVPINELPPPDLCGNCTLCLDACPTQAFAGPYVLDSRRCISYLTIELRGAIPEQLRADMGRAVFGCDICQEVCPWNRKAPVTAMLAFEPRELGGPRISQAQEESSQARQSALAQAGPLASTRAPALDWLATLSKEEFSEAFRRSAVKRAKWRGLVRNACVALGNSGPRRDSPSWSRIIGLLETLARSDDTVIREHAAWALERVGRVEPAQRLKP